jgi:hypothetical protein
VHTLLSLQFIPQFPQLLVVVVDVSQPFPVFPSQFPYPELQELILQVPQESQVGGLEHVLVCIPAPLVIEQD